MLGDFCNDSMIGHYVCEWWVAHTFEHFPFQRQVFRNALKDEHSFTNGVLEFAERVNVSLKGKLV